MDGSRSTLTRPPTSASSLFGQAPQYKPQQNQNQNMLQMQQLQQQQQQQQQQPPPQHQLYQSRSFDVPALAASRSIGPGTDSSAMFRTAATQRAGQIAARQNENVKEVLVEEKKTTVMPVVPVFDLKDDLIRDLQSDLEKLKKNCTCVVCQDLLFEPYALSCGHVFCYTCTRDWMKNKKNCPECRSKVKTQPAPAYLVRDMIETFVMRAELQSPHDEGQALRQTQSEALKEVKKDQDSIHGLFAGMFIGKERQRAVMDDGDRVMRCPDCMWEIEDGTCPHCGRRFRASELPGGSDLSDDSSDMSGSDSSDSEEDSEGEEIMMDDDHSHVSTGSGSEATLGQPIDIDAEEFRRQFMRSTRNYDFGDFGPGGVEAVQEVAFRAIENMRTIHSGALRAGHVGSYTRRGNWSGDAHGHHDHHHEVEWEDELNSEDFDEEEEEDDEDEENSEDDEEDSDMNSFIEHDTSPAMRRSRPAHYRSASPPYPGRNGSRSMTPRSVESSFQASSSPQVSRATGRNNRRVVHDDDDEEENSSVSDFPASRRHYAGGRAPIVISSDNDDEEEEGLMNHYEQLDDDTNDDDDTDSMVNEMIPALPVVPTATAAADPPARRRRNSVRFDVPEDADEEDYGSDLSRDVEGDLDMDRHSSAEPTSARNGNNRSAAPFQLDTTLSVDGDNSSDDSLPVQRRRRPGPTASASNLRGNNRLNPASTRRGSAAATNARSSASNRPDPEIRRMLGHFHRQREADQLGMFGRPNADEANEVASNSRATGGSASHDLAQLNSPIVISSSPAVRTANTIPSNTAGSTRRASQSQYSPTDRPSATITNLNETPNPYEIGYASRDSTPAQFSPLVEHGQSNMSSNRRMRQSNPPTTQSNTNPRMRRQSNNALRGQPSRNRIRDSSNSTTGGESSRQSNTPNDAATEQRRQRGRETVLERQRAIADSTSSITNRAAAARSNTSTAPTSAAQRLRQDFGARRATSNPVSRDSATPTPNDAMTASSRPGVRRADTAELPVGGRRRLAANIGRGPSRGGPLLVVGDEDDL